MLGKLAWQAFGFAFGLFNLSVMVLMAGVRDGAFTKRTSRKQKLDLAAAQNKYWNLQGQPLPGFSHQFFELRNGLRLHYVVNSSPNTSTTKNVAVFIHGFPDSFLLWRNLLTSGSLQSHILIAVDLPGYGGSDSLAKYNAQEVLEAITEFILGMRERFLNGEAKMVVVSHDWGGLIAARLASEANQLADRWIVAGAIIPQHALSNWATKAASTKQMLHTYLRNPLNLSLFKNALSTLTPVLSQIGRSFYILISFPPMYAMLTILLFIVIFNLPYPLGTYFATFGNYWLVHVMHKCEAGLLRPDGTWVRELDSNEAMDFLAMTSGPGSAELEGGKMKYPDTVRKRIGDHGMAEKIRIYRENLLLSTWEKSLETVVALSEIPTSTSRSSSGGSGKSLFDDGPPGALKAPATIVYGKDDLGFERRLALEGIDDYLSKSSQVLFLEDAGHWTPHENYPSKVLVDVVEWAMGDEKAPLKARFEGLDKVKFLVDK